MSPAALVVFRPLRAREAASPRDRKAAHRCGLQCHRGPAGCPTPVRSDGPDGAANTGADRHDIQSWRGSTKMVGPGAVGFWRGCRGGAPAPPCRACIGSVANKRGQRPFQLVKQRAARSVQQRRTGCNRTGPVARAPPESENHGAATLWCSPPRPPRVRGRDVPSHLLPPSDAGVTEDEDTGEQRQQQRAPCHYKTHVSPPHSERRFDAT
jgi:hypothetical protein